jgi:hypothetical protein
MEEDEARGACNMYGELTKLYRALVAKSEETDCMRNIGLCENVIFLNESAVRMWADS